MRYLRFTCFIFLLLIVTRSSHCPATGILTPQWDSKQQMTLKSLQVKSNIEGSISITRCQYHFNNNTGRRMEALFQFRLPDGGVVTEFAYYFQGRRVQAYIVEDKRAQSIYQKIVAMKRDPALLKRVKGNLFKAKIFPVEPEGIKIEVTYIHPLPSTNGGKRYIFNLAGPYCADKIEDFSFSCQYALPYPVEKVQCNYPHQVSSEESKPGVLSVDKKNFSPDKPLEIILFPQVEGMRTYLYAARSGGRAGFFVLSLTSPADITNPRVDIYGIRTFQVFRESPRSLKAGASITLTGRYIPGKSHIYLSGYSHGRYVRYKARKEFSNEAVPNNPATKLWADRHLESLGKRAGKLRSKKLTNEAISLSKRFGIPGPFTSFLAVPPSEKLVYYRSSRNRVENFEWKLKNLGRRKGFDRELRPDGKLEIALRPKITRGDPLIQVEAPEDALSVTALFPDGSVRNLIFDSSRKKWLTRFNIPMSANDGIYEVTVVITLKDGTRRTVKFKYDVCRTSPEGRLKSLRANSAENSLEIEVQGDPTVARVLAVTPWGQEEFALENWDCVFKRNIRVPEEYHEKEYHIQIVIMDKAHNRMIITVSPAGDEGNE